MHVLVLIATKCSFLFSQEKVITHTQQNWIQYYNQTQVNEKVIFLFDAGIRTNINFKEKKTTLARIGLQYKVSEQLHCAVGGAYFLQHINSNPSTEEWRIYQELGIQQKIKTIGITQRYRLEERFFYDLKDHAHKFNYRHRYKLAFQLPINKTSDNNMVVSALLADEIFINSGKRIANNYFDQNRILAGVGFKWNKNLNMSLHYSFQFAQRAPISVYEDADIIWLSITHQLFRKSN